MRTLGTKVDDELAERFYEMCNREGKTVSDELRECIESFCEAFEDGQELELDEEESQKITISEIPEEEKKPKVFTHGKILDDYGNVIGTF